MKVAFFSECGFEPRELKKSARKAVSAALKYKNLKSTDPYEVSIVFVGKERIREINRDYRGIDRATDVISFALREGEGAEFTPFVLGDLYICDEVVADHAVRYGNSLETEMLFMIVHGMLHLLGFDHHKKGEREVMRQAENELMTALCPEWRGRGEE